MLASGARGRLVDILMRESCGEGGINTAAAIHNNSAAFPHPPKARRWRRAMLEGRKRNAFKTRRCDPRQRLTGGPEEEIADGHTDRQGQHYDASNDWVGVSWVVVEN